MMETAFISQDEKGDLEGGKMQKGASSIGAHHAPNERMQLTWLIGAPIHVGLGSPACRRAARPRLTRHAADAGR